MPSKTTNRELLFTQLELQLAARSRLFADSLELLADSGELHAKSYMFLTMECIKLKPPLDVWILLVYKVVHMKSYLEPIPYRRCPPHEA